MNKKALLAGAVILGSLLPLSSCYMDTPELIEAETFSQAYDLFKTFFAKTLEHKNMTVRIDRDHHYVKDSDSGTMFYEGITEIEQILGDSSYCFNAEQTESNWAFIDSGGNKIAANEKETIEEDGLSYTERSYCIDEKEYQNIYKSYIKLLDFFTEIAEESVATGKTPEEVGHFERVEKAAIQKRTYFYGGQRQHWEEFTCNLISYNSAGYGDYTPYQISAVIYGDEGLVENADVQLYDLRNDEYWGSDRISFKFEYDNVNKIDIPDVSTWDLRNEQ
ncbi:MAG: hypothetical protein K6G74_02180 [Bacilli bacterium]|nr:hypothetical protein [Bacilli bacterium]